MKKLFAILLLTSNVFLFSQSNEIMGDYYLKFEGEEHLIEYKLILNQAGTFTFHFYRNLKAGVPSITNSYGKGTWTANRKVVSFFTDKEKDFDEKYMLDFRNSRAHFVTKPARDNTDRIIKTRLKFFESDIFWIEGLDIFKI